jgi:flagellar protein FliS
MNKKHLMNQYKGVQLKTDVEEADPHKLVSMLLNGALQNLIAAKASIEKGAKAEHGELVGKAISIVEYLRVSLDPGSDLDFAENLGELYRYMETRLLDSTMKNDSAPVAEVIELIKPLRDGWDAIPSEYRN